MKLKLGRIGTAEAVCAASISLCVNGIFNIDPGYAYSNGNSTYLSVPLAALASLAVLALAAAAIKKRGLKNLWQLLELSLGRFLGAAAALMLCASLAFCAARPIGSITQVLDGLVYEGVEYPVLFAFIFPVTVFIAFRGMETISRTARVFAGLLLAAVITAFLSSLPGQQSYRLYPILGEGAGRFFSFTASQGLSFLTPLTVLLTAGEGLHGVGFARRAGAYAAGISALVCAFVLFMLARVYSYKALSELFMPLCRINYLSVERGYIMWLDKLLVMVWLNGCIISSAYCIYGAALLYAQTFAQRDVGPAVLFVSLIVGAYALCEYSLGVSWAETADSLLLRYGVLLAFAPIALAACAAMLKKTHGKGVQRSEDSPSAKAL